MSLLHDSDIPDPNVVRRVPGEQVPRRLIHAFEQRDWEELLALLRTDVSRFLRPEQIAYMRSRAYEGLNELTPALAFMDEAARRARTSTSFLALSMELLWKDARYEEAYVRAKTYLEDAASPARLAIMGGGVVCRRAQQDHPPVDIAAVSALTINRLERAMLQETVAAVRIFGYGALGLLAARIGDRAKAEAALKQAIDIDAGTGKQLAARGLLVDELELVRNGRLQSGEERSLARQLAEVLVPDLYSTAA